MPSPRTTVRRQGHGQRRTESHRRRIGDAGPQERDDRLDPPRKRPRQDQGHGETHPQKTRLPAGPAGRSRKNGSRPGRATLPRLGVGMMNKAQSRSRTKLGRWTPALAKCRALSLRQPWAWLVVNGYKDVENRSWRTNHRGSLLIHTSSTTTDFTLEKLAWIRSKYGVAVPETVDIGGIVGLVEVVDCVRRHPSKWHFLGNWAWVLKNPRRLSYRECKAVVGFSYQKSRPRRNELPRLSQCRLAPHLREIRRDACRRLST